MGKRELLLIGVFLVLGMGVYQMTAPPPKPGQEGFSFGKLFSHIRAEIQGEDARARVDRKAQQAVGASVARLNLPDFRGMLTLVGEDRADVEVELHGFMAGIDETVAKTRAAATLLTLEPEEDEITIKISRAEETPRLRNAELRLRVPARLAVTLEYRGEADLRGVAEVKFQSSRGRTNIRDVGAVRGEYVNGEIEVLGVGEIDLKTQRTQVRIDGVKKMLVLEAEHGEVRIQRVGGAVKLDLDRVECEGDAIKGETTVRMEHGNLTLRGINAPVEITGDGSALDLIMASAVPLSATTSGDELTVELPRSGGVTLDAVTQHGRLRLPDRALEVKEGDDEQRSDAKIRGGGPTLRLRNEHADIVIRDGGMMEEHKTDGGEAEHPRTPAPPRLPEPLEPPKPPPPPPGPPPVPPRD